MRPGRHDGGAHGNRTTLARMRAVGSLGADERACTQKRIGIARHRQIGEDGQAMNHSISRELAKAIANVAIFFEDAAEDVLDPDAAIQMLEQFASDLKKMNDSDRSALIRRLKEVSAEYGDAARREFVFGLPEALGLK